MNSELFRGMIFNASLLLTISIFYNIYFAKYWKNKVLYNILLGVLIGFIGILVVINSVELSKGVIFDARSILVSVIGMFFGFIPTFIAVLIISIYRIIIGGAGTLTGVVTTVMTAVIGLIWYKYRLNNILLRKKGVWFEFYLFGFITHIIMLLCMLTLPREMVFSVIKAISIPVLVLYPVGTTLLCLVIFTGFKNIQTELNLKKSELYFRTMFEQAPIGISISNDTGILYVNLMFEKVLGRSKEEICALGWVNITHPDDLENDMIQYNLLKRGVIEGYSMLKRYLRPDGSSVWVNMTVASLHINNQAHNDHLCMIQDITDIMIAKDNLLESEAKYKNLYLEYQQKQVLLLSLINSIPDLIFYKDFDGIYMGCNKAFENFVGKKEDKVIGRNDYDLFDKETAASFRKMDMSMMKQKSQRKNEELVKYPDGEKVFLETLKTPYYDAENNVVGLIGISRDITERKQKEEEILYLNYHDILTGLYNRTFFEEAWKRLDEKSQLPLSIIIGDINGLKVINEVFGHEEGDKFLFEIAKILKSCCRENDIIARTGGDEFRILLPKTDIEYTRMIRDSIETTCREHGKKSGKGVYYTNISLGYATKIIVEESFEKVIEDAEGYMYKLKFLEHRSMYSSIISSIKTTVNEKSYETEEHAERMATLSRKLGKEVGLSEEELITLELATTLHDIGKISIDRNILTKPGKLSKEEWDELKKHPEVGYRITQTIPELRGVSEHILCHHERWDGKGYPQGLAGEDIPLLARILSVVDSYDAMTQDRSYKRAITKEEAIIEIRNNAGTQFDSEIARIFIEKILTKEK